MREGSFAKGLEGESLLKWEAEQDPEIIDMARKIREDLGLPELPADAKSAFEGLDYEQKSKVRNAIEWQKAEEESKRERGATEEEVEEALKDSSF